MPITEVGCHPVKHGVDVVDETTREGQIMARARKAVTSEKTGPYRVYWGLEVENPSNSWGFFDFETVEEHERFAREFVSTEPGLRTTNPKLIS